MLVMFNWELMLFPIINLRIYFGGPLSVCMYMSCFINSPFFMTINISVPFFVQSFVCIRIESIDNLF